MHDQDPSLTSLLLPTAQWFVFGSPTAECVGRDGPDFLLLLLHGDVRRVQSFDLRTTNLHPVVLVEPKIRLAPVCRFSLSIPDRAVAAHSPRRPEANHLHLCVVAMGPFLCLARS